MSERVCDLDDRSKEKDDLCGQNFDQIQNVGLHGEEDAGQTNHDSSDNFESAEETDLNVGGYYHKGEDDEWEFVSAAFTDSRYVCMCVCAYVCVYVWVLSQGRRR